MAGVPRLYSRKKKGMRREADHYPTPQSAIDPLMWEARTTGMAANWRRILDLGCGDGRLGTAAAAAHKAAGGGNSFVLGVESDAERAEVARHNGLAVANRTLEQLGHPRMTVDLNIANPPFSQFEEFLDFAHAQRGPCDIVFLLRLNALGAQKRYDFWTKREPPVIRVLSERPSFTAKATGVRNTDSTEYAWFIWPRRGLTLPPLGWYAPSSAKEAS
jgi:predicted RNA methylase